MAKCQFVMVLVVEDIEQIGIEGVDVFYFGEMLEGVSQFFRNGVLAELYFPHVERSDSGDRIARVHDSGGLSLGFGEHDVDEVAGWWDHFDVLEIVAHLQC